MGCLKLHIETTPTLRLIPSKKGQKPLKKTLDYYPFGLEQFGYNRVVDGGDDWARSWRFGGKEYNGEQGLNWYDVSARNYDPAIGRWMNIDPLAEAMRRHSPYNYAFDNPIFFVDPDGMQPMALTTFQQTGNSDSAGFAFSSSGTFEFMSNGSTSGSSGGAADPPNKYKQFFKQAGAQVAAGNYSVTPTPTSTSSSGANNSGTTYNGKLYGGDGSGGFLDALHKVVYELDKLNPIAHFGNTIRYAIDGKDLRGNEMGLGEATLGAVSIVPATKLATSAVSSAIKSLTSYGVSQNLSYGTMFRQDVYRLSVRNSAGQFATGTGTPLVGRVFNQYYGLNGLGQTNSFTPTVLRQIPTVVRWAIGVGGASFFLASDTANK